MSARNATGSTVTATGSTDTATAASIGNTVSSDSVDTSTIHAATFLKSEESSHLMTSEVISNAGTGRRLLRSTRESEGVGLRCPFYTRTVEAAQDVPSCVADEQQLQGIWFAAHVTGGYIRQVRLETSVSANSDPSIYLTGIVISQTKP